MAEKTLYNLRNNAARLGQRLGENLAEHSRDLGLIDSFASGSGGGSGKYLEDGGVLTDAGTEETKRMLASRREVDRVDGLKRVIAMMTKNLPVTQFFPLVTSLLSPSTPLQARTLVSLYIIHCAATAPELALLSINAYQKDLSDPNSIVRAGAIKTLSSMGLEDIRSLVGLSITKGARDGSWYVRRASAMAISALWEADRSHENCNALLPTVAILLESASPLTIGSALLAWEELSPSNWEILHGNYRKWCKMLIDVEEWGQCVLLRLLLRYGRTFFLDPEATDSLDPDAELLLRSSEPLLQHMNPAVVFGVVKLHYYLAPPKGLGKIVKPMLRLLDASEEVRGVVLQNFALIAEEKPFLLEEHLSEFFVKFSEDSISKKARLRILVALADNDNAKTLLKEFLIYVKDNDVNFSADAIFAIGHVAGRVKSVASECLKTLVKFTQSRSEVVVTRSVLVLRSLLRSRSVTSPSLRSSIITRLVTLTQSGHIQSPIARSNVYWLVGQFAEEGLLETVGPDTMRLGTKGFSSEASTAKLQLLTLMAKFLVLSYLSSSTHHFRTLSLIFTYMTTLARYDLDYEVRDRARFLKQLLASASVGIDGESANIALNEEDFAKGVQVEDFNEKDEINSNELDKARRLTVAQVKKILFDGKESEGRLLLFNTNVDKRIGAELGVFELLIDSKRLAFTSPLPSYPRTAPPSSIRDPFSPPEHIRHRPASDVSTANSRSVSPAINLKGFGSDSFRNDGGGTVKGSRGRSSPIVLVPTNFAAADLSRSGSPAPGGNGRKLGFVDLDDFYASEEASSKTETEDEEEEGETDEDEAGGHDEEISSGHGDEKVDDEEDEDDIGAEEEDGDNEVADDDDDNDDEDEDEDEDHEPRESTIIDSGQADPTTRGAAQELLDGREGI